MIQTMNPQRRQMERLNHKSVEREAELNLMPVLRTPNQLLNNQRRMKNKKQLKLQSQVMIPQMMIQAKMTKRRSQLENQPKLKLKLLKKHQQKHQPKKLIAMMTIVAMMILQRKKSQR
jgi:hypothetical protein